MKQSKFVQEFFHEGLLSNVTAKIVVTMNYTFNFVIRNNPVAHDDYPQRIYFHKIESYINGDIYHTIDKIENEADVIKEVKKLKTKLQKLIEEMSNLPAQKTFINEMRELGFLS